MRHLDSFNWALEHLLKEWFCAFCVSYNTLCTNLKEKILPVIRTAMEHHDKLGLGPFFLIAQLH